MIKNKESAKHLSQSVRMLGVAQFAHYGVVSLDKLIVVDSMTNDKNALGFFLLSAIFVITTELVGYKILNKDGL